MSILQDQIMTKNQRNENHSQKANTSGLSFLQSMSNLTAINREVKAYVHPIEKRSISKLNEKSLEMCTESLGTETGSESGSEELSLLAFEATVTPPRVPKPTLLAKKSTSFPPPIKVEYNRMVRTLGEDGRLIVKAVKVSTRPLCFVAERCEGRLRLSLSPEREEEEEEAEEEIIEKVEGKTGNKKISSRLSSRCKENGLESKPMQFWVAT